MSKEKILVIEDTQSIRDEIFDILSFEGMEVFIAENGQEGIDLANKCEPDLILCDIMMPVKDGYEVFNEVKHNADLKNTPFIFLTAKSTKDNIRQGMILGVDDYITKPFSIDLLLDSIKTRLKKEELRKKGEAKKLQSLQYNISQAIPHELLTPLNIIIGLTANCKNLDVEFNPLKAQEYAEKVNDSAKLLLETVNKFIYYTEVELLLNKPDDKERLLKETVEMGVLFLTNQCYVIAEKHDRLKDLEIIPDLFNIKIALGHFDIIISNIVDNAFKFSKKEDEVIVKVFKNDSHVFISIEDSGSGITADKMKQVDAFTQFDVNKNKLTQNGLGLGLITSKKLIEFYGGSLKMSSKKDKGTIVQISLLLADK
jgi:two-component system sensor histidine kinase/response regulator